MPITAEPLPESNRPFLGGSPTQIAQDLARVETLGVDHVLFADTASTTVEEAVRRAALSTNSLSVLAVAFLEPKARAQAIRIPPPLPITTRLNLRDVFL